LQKRLGEALEIRVFVGREKKASWEGKEKVFVEGHVLPWGRLALKKREPHSWDGKEKYLIAVSGRFCGPK